MEDRNINFESATFPTDHESYIYKILGSQMIVAITNLNPDHQVCTTQILYNFKTCHCSKQHDAQAPINCEV